MQVCGARAPGLHAEQRARDGRVTEHLRSLGSVKCRLCSCFFFFLCLSGYVEDTHRLTAFSLKEFTRLNTGHIMPLRCGLTLPRQERLAAGQVDDTFLSRPLL